jgi:hypothetical protein
MNFNWPPITSDSVVLISAAEATDAVYPTGFTLQPYFGYVLGSADVYATNVSPHYGGVEFILHVNWDAPLNIAVDIVVLDPPFQFFA